MNVYFCVLLVILTLSPAALLAQEPPRSRKPVLIRDEVNKKDDEVEAKIKVHDPEQAKKSVKIGDYYAKRDNLQAAEARYLEAIDYNTRWGPPYEKLVKLYEKQDRYQDGLHICDLFLTANPGSDDTGKFQKLRKRMIDKGAAEKPVGPEAP
jgi:outer membrane protein assembly factor BamD (BamD/ComL family)